MSKATLTPYLNFNGTTRQAMEFYQQVLGGKLELKTFGETKGMPVPPGFEDKIMHSRLDADGFTIMASEGQPGEKVKVGDNITLTLGGTDLASLTKAFNGLAAGGTVGMPLEKQFWGDVSGMLTDKFGIHWMVNVTKA